MSAREGSPHRDDPGLQRSLRAWQRAGSLVFLALVLAFPLYRAVDSSRRADALGAMNAAQTRLGQELWGLNCASCHGLQGEGVDAPALNSQQFLGSVADEQIERITSAGIPGTEMPAWLNELGGPLTDQQIVAIIAYLRSWEDTAPDRPDWRSPRGAHMEEGQDHMSDETGG